MRRRGWRDKGTAQGVKTADPIRKSVSQVIDDPSTRADLLNAFPVPVWICDARGDCTFVNQAWQDYTGRDVGTEQGAGWLETVHPDDRGEIERSWREAVGLRRPFTAQYRL